MPRKIHNKMSSINFGIVASMAVVIIGGAVITSGSLNTVKTKNAFASELEIPQAIIPPVANPPTDYFQPEENTWQNQPEDQESEPKIVMPPAVNVPTNYSQPSAQTNDEVQIITAINQEIQKLTKTQQRILNAVKNIFN